MRKMYRELHGNITPVERAALAWVKAQVKLLSSKQEPDIKDGLSIFVSVLDNGTSCLRW